MFFPLKFSQICWFPGQRRRPEQRPCPSFVAPPVGTPQQRLPPRLGWSVHSHSTIGVCTGQASRTEGPGHIYQFCCSPPGPTHKLFTQVLSNALDTKQYTVICWYFLLFLCSPLSSRSSRVSGQHIDLTGAAASFISLLFGYYRQWQLQHPTSLANFYHAMAR